MSYLIKFLKSKTRIYFATWLVLSICLICTYIVMNKKTELLWIYLLIITTSVITVNFLEGHRIVDYAKTNYPEEYKRMKTLNNISNVHNGFSAISFVFSDTNSDDTTLLELRSNYKKLIGLLIFIFFTSMILVFILSALRNF